MGTVKIRILFLALLPLSIWASKLQYEVQFAGLAESALLQDLRNTSDLVSLKNRPPASVNGLQYRAQADIPKLLQILKAYAYYDARITYEIRVENEIFYVDLFIHPGPAYLLRSYEFFHGDCLDSTPLPRCPAINPPDVGLKLNQIADSTSIVNAEITALTRLASCGYPLAYIDKRRVIVDMAEKKVDAAVCIQEGPLCRFGPITYFGLKNVNPRFIDQKITWKEGEIFNLDLIDETQNRLIKSDLFSSVLISHAEELDQSGELSMKIRLAEAKHRSISLGFFYATVDGPGGTVCWVHRNLRGMGEYLCIEGNVSKRFIDGSATWRKPDFFHIDQTFTILAKASRENIIPYRAFTYLESNRIERQINSHTSVSAGFSGQYINVHKSVNNGHFFVLGLPLYAEYSTADSPLNPTKGLMISYLATPYQSLNKSRVHFVKQKLTGNFYIPLTEERKVVLALHAQFGSVAGTAQKEIPIPLLFLGGSENDLRGYGYKTVSPLGRKKGRRDKDSPRGGRSAIFTTIEFRFRVTKTIGIVPFADFGTVALGQWPQIHTKWYRSVGGGLRYYTFFGPLRLDVGFPLNRRKNLDTWGKIYASIGQCF